MGKPAARLGDMTAHGGALVLGNPTVLAGKMPVSCLGDMHVCPMFTALVPHVGGPVLLGSFGVFAGGRPVARMGDPVICVGPPDTIALGAFTVLVGDISPGSGGAGAGEAGGGSGSAIAMAIASAIVKSAKAAALLAVAVATSAAASSVGAAAATAGGSSETATGKSRPGHWIRFKFVDKAGLPVAGVPYAFEGPAGLKLTGATGSGGEIYRDGLRSGQCTVRLMDLSDAKWSVDKAKVGDSVTLSAQAEGFPDGTAATVRIFCRDLRGPDLKVEERSVEVSGGKVETQWAFQEKEDDDEDAPAGYSSPEFFFVVEAEGCQAVSGMLEIQNWVELELKDEDGQLLADEEYRALLPTGEIRKGKTDSKGRARIDDVPPGPVRVEIPRFPGSSSSTATS